MSNPTRTRLIRAVRLLPGAVRISHGTMEEVLPDDEPQSASAKESINTEQSALVIAEAEIRKLKSELRDKEEALSESRAQERTLRSQIDGIRADVERERTELREAAAREAAESRETAARAGHEEGYQKGYTEGLQKAESEKQAEYEAKFGEALEIVGGINKSLEDAREKLVRTHTTELIRLWEMMLQRLLQVHVTLDPTVVERVLKNILTRVSDRERILIYLNPADIALVEGSKEHLIDTIRGVKVFELLSDDHVDRGSCLIETNLGIYDARWRTQMEQISSEVQNLLMESMVSDDANDG